MFIFSSKSFLVIVYTSMLVIILSGCTSRSALVDFNKNTNFAQLNSYYIYSVSDDDQIGAVRIVDQAQLLFERKGALIVDSEFADARVEIEHFMEEQKNDSRFSFGLGTGSYGRSGSIGVGGSVDLPISKNLIPYAVVMLRVIVKDEVVWQGSQRVELNKEDSRGVAKAQVEALEDILGEYPLGK